MRYVIAIVVFLNAICLALGISPAGAVDREPFSLRSQYKNSATGGWQGDIVWRLVPEAEHRHTIFRQGTSSAAMVLEYDEYDRLTRIDDRLVQIHSRSIDADESLVLSWGFPVPYDYLAPADRRQGEMTISKTVADTRFSYAVIRRVQILSFQQAVSQGMLPEGDSPSAYTGGELTLITIDYEGDTLVRQLWQESDWWWLYEETESRRSWRMP